MRFVTYRNNYRGGDFLVMALEYADKLERGEIAPFTTEAPHA